VALFQLTCRSVAQSAEQAHQLANSASPIRGRERGLSPLSPYQLLVLLELLGLLNSIRLDAGNRQTRDDRWDNPYDRRCPPMEVPGLVRLDGTSSGRRLGSKRELLLLFPVGDLHFDQRHSHAIELAVSAVSRRK